MTRTTTVLAAAMLAACLDSGGDDSERPDPQDYELYECRAELGLNGCTSVCSQLIRVTRQSCSTSTNSAESDVCDSMRADYGEAPSAPCRVSCSVIEDDCD